jgi:hypothetical protein
MTELERFRDHAAEMATAEHVPDCAGMVGAVWGLKHVRPDPACPGCLTDADRALWARLAAEIDDYLAADDAPLWEDA